MNPTRRGGQMGLAGLGWVLMASALAQGAPQGQVLGPGWVGHPIAAEGTVIAENGACRQIAVDQAGVPGAGGRLWGCWTTHPERAPDLGQRTHIRGTVTTTRLTRMGPFWRVVPLVEGL